MDGWLWGALSRKQSLGEGLKGEHSLFITCRVFHLSYPGSPPWVGKIPWRRAWQPTSVFLPGESHGQRNLAGYNLAGLWRVGHDWEAKHSTAQCFPKPHVLLFITKAEIHMPHLCSPWQWKQIIYLTWFNKGLYLVRSQRKLLINWMGSIKDLCSIVQLSTEEYSFTKHVLIHWLFTGRENGTFIWKYIKWDNSRSQQLTNTDLFQYCWERCCKWTQRNWPGPEGPRLISLPATVLLSDLPHWLLFLPR